jgi:hypothetical protein
MGQERAIEAISRIEQALARIEAASAAVQATSAADGAVPAEAPDERLHRAHVALRSRVEGAIAQIDRLIESEESA